MTRLYTVEEANRTLPYVRVVVEEIRTRYSDLRDRSREHNGVPESDQRKRLGLREEIRVEANGIRACLEELQELGIEVRDYERGLVDFASELNGRPISICWDLDQDQVQSWYEVDDGYESRKPVPPNEPAWPRGIRPLASSGR